MLSGSGLDYFASLSGLHQNGFRNAGDEEQSVQFYGNLGYRASNGAEHRLHFTYMKQDLELPGSLTKDQIKDNPKQANKLWAGSRGQRDFAPLLRLDRQTALTLSSATRLDLGASWQQLEMFHVLPSFLFSTGSPRSQILTPTAMTLRSMPGCIRRDIGSAWANSSRSGRALLRRERARLLRAPFFLARPQKAPRPGPRTVAP